jgi:hypothetical protein
MRDYDVGAKGFRPYKTFEMNGKKGTKHGWNPPPTHNVSKKEVTKFI